MVKGHTSLRDKLQLKLPFHRNGGLRGPCAHCKLIDSGDVALYGVTCPQCGEIPPSRRHRYPQLSNGHVRFYLSNRRLQTQCNYNMKSHVIQSSTLKTICVNS